METLRERATETLPSVLLTLLSMIQALALELLWTRMRESPYLWSGDWLAVLCWAQVVTMVLGFLQIWLFYTSLVMRFRWVPSSRDSILPFGIGILEFALIDLLGPDTFGYWFLALALVFAASTWASHGIFRLAREHPANREFFDVVGRATLRDFTPEIGGVAAFVLLGTALLVTGNRGWLAMVSMAVAFGLLAYQLHLTRAYWNLSIRPGESPEALTALWRIRWAARLAVLPRVWPQECRQPPQKHSCPHAPYPILRWCRSTALAFDAGIPVSAAIAGHCRTATMTSSMICLARAALRLQNRANSSRSSAAKPSRFPFTLIWCLDVQVPEGL